MLIGKDVSKSLTLRFACAIALVLPGCVSSDPDGSPLVIAPDLAAEAPAPACSVPFSQTVQPQDLNGGHHLYFDPAKIAFLSDPNLRVQSVYLNARARGKLKGDAFEVPLSINGLQTSGRDGSSVYQLLRYHADADVSEIRHHVHKMVVNGTEPIRSFMLKVLGNKGTIKLSLHGKNLHILSASIEVVGYSVAGCGGSGPGPDPEPTPSPTPTLPPVPPVTVIESANPAGALTSSTVISFSFSSNQVGSSFQCSLDNAEPELCGSPKAYSGLGDGDHVFRVIATNAAGIADPVGASHSWKVNSLLPGATLENLDTLPSVTSSTTIEFTFSQPGASGYLCSLDGGEALPCSSPMVYSELIEGLHQFTVTSVDSNGNIANNPAGFQWVIDATAPVSSIIDVNPASAQNNASSVELAFMANEPAEFECSLDGADFEICSSPHSISELSETQHQFQVRARDAAGNVGLPVRYAWVSDFSAPVVSLDQASPLPGLSNGAQIYVEFSANELVVFSCSFDGGDFAPCSSPFAAPIFNSGNHALAIISEDPAGNVSAPLRLEWLIDLASPEISFDEILPSAASRINSTWLNASVRSSESVSLQANLNGVTLAQPTSPISLTGLAEGSYSLEVSALDQVGNASNTIQHSFIVDLTAPTISLSAEISGLTNSSGNTITIAVSETSQLECQLNGAGFSACSSPVALSGLAEGNHVFEARAKDLAGNVGSAASIQWTVDLSAPVVTLNVSRNTNAAIQFSFTSNENQSSFFCSLDGGVFAPCVSPVSYSNVAIGTHSFAVKAKDLAGNTGTPASHGWSVDPPVNTFITGVNPGASLTRQTWATFTFGSNVGISFRCSLDGGALSACSSPSSFYSLPDGVHVFRVYAVDRWGTQDAVGASFSWTVDASPPVILSISSAKTSSSITITWTTNEPATSGVNWGVGYDTSRVVAPNGTYVTSHSVRLSGLMPNTLYSFVVSGADAAGNTYSSTRYSVRTNY